MNRVRTRITRLTAASALALGLGALAAGPALASYSSWAGSASPDSVTLSAEDGASTDGKPSGINSVEDGAGTDSVTLAAEDGASPMAPPPAVSLPR